MSNHATPPVAADAAQNHPALAVTGLRKTFHSLVAVDNVSLTVPSGSFFGLLGPNGAGKTTTLLMAVGLLRPDRGRVTVFNHDVWANPFAAKTMMGVLPDGQRLFDRLTGAELLRYHGLLRGLTPSLIAVRSNELLAVLGLDHAAGQLVMDYSSGMKKKVGLACALLHAPSLLVLDEPFEAIDPLSAHTIRSLLTNYVAAGSTVVMSSHMLPAVAELCDRVAIMVNGGIAVSGPIDDVLAHRSLEDAFIEVTGGRPVNGEELAWLRSSPDSNSV